jgi:hypothetical protein
VRRRVGLWHINFDGQGRLKTQVKDAPGPGVLLWEGPATDPNLVKEGAKGWLRRPQAVSGRPMNAFPAKTVKP